MSEALRKFGYYFRNRKGKMKYYWDTTIDPLGPGGNKSLMRSRISRFIRFLLGFFGSFKYTWRVLDFLFGPWLFNVKKIREETINYRHVVIIQTANWGYQERFLGYFARKNSYRTILVPYTTDQTTINGYMISDYDMICAQGPVETHFLKHYHGVPDDNISNLGMLWLRNYELLLDAHNTKSALNNNSLRKILYAGLTPDTFPRESEFLAVDKILEMISKGTIPRATLVYRPVGLNRKEHYLVEQKYKNNDLIEIQLPQISMIGIKEKHNGTVASEVESYIEQISEIDLMVMSATTTMAFEMWYKRVPCIANFTDPTGTLSRRGFTTSYIDDDAFLNSAKGMLISFTLEEMITHICTSLKYPQNTENIALSALYEWDYGNKDYVKDFIDIIEGFFEGKHD